MENNKPPTPVNDFNEMENKYAKQSKIIEDWLSMDDDEKIEFLDDIWGQGTIGEIVVNDDYLSSVFLTHIQLNDNLFEQIKTALIERADD